MLGSFKASTKRAKGAVWWLESKQLICSLATLWISPEGDKMFWLRPMKAFKATGRHQKTNKHKNEVILHEQLDCNRRPILTWLPMLKAVLLIVFFSPYKILIRRLVKTLDGNPLAGFQPNLIFLPFFFKLVMSKDLQVQTMPWTVLIHSVQWALGGCVQILSANAHCGWALLSFLLSFAGCLQLGLQPHLQNKNKKEKKKQPS